MPMNIVPGFFISNFFLIFLIGAELKWGRYVSMPRRKAADVYNFIDYGHGHNGSDTWDAH